MNTLYLCPSGISALEYIRKKSPMPADAKADLEDFFRDADEGKLMEASAEINSLLRMGLNENDKVVFLASDTDQGDFVAKQIVKVLKRGRNCEAISKRIIGLQTDDKKKFDNKGIPNLAEAIIEEIERNRYSYKIVLNATAGFKATVPYLTFIGMVFHLPIRYIFERSENIIELPPIPIEFDLERLKQLEGVIDNILNDYMSLREFEKLTCLSYDDLQDLLKDVLFEEDGLVTMRPTGRILYQRYLQVKGNKVFISSVVQEKLRSGRYDRQVFKNLFLKFRDPVHLQSKLHNEVKSKGRVDLDCYKAGSTSERIFYYMEGKNVRVCDIFFHEEYERAIEQGGLLRIKYEKNIFEEFSM